MTEGNKMRGRQSPPKNLNTKGCCFLCLRIVDFKTEGNETILPLPTVSLKCVYRHLKIKTKNIPSKSVGAPEIGDGVPKDRQEVNANLCESCRKIVHSFTKSFLLLEKAQMEVSYWVKKIHQQISEASNEPDVVQNYSKRMTSDPETLIQLVFVDNLRKEIANKCSKTAGSLPMEPKIELFRLYKVKVKKRLMKSPKAESADNVNPDFKEEENFDSVPLVLEETYDDKDFAAAAAVPTTNVEDDGGNPVLDSHSSRTDNNTDSVPRIKTRGRKSKVYTKNLESGTFDCLICNEQFSTPTSVGTHYQTAHLGNCLKCEVCGRDYASKQSLERHKNQQCNGTANPIQAKPRAMTILNPETGKHDCVICKQEFSHRVLAWEHYQKVHLHKRYKCNYCNAVCKTSSHLNSHKRNCKDSQERRKAKKYGPEYKFTCETCGLKFKKNWILQSHSKHVHLNPQNFKCDLCEKTFKWKSSIEAHRRSVHFGEKLKCKICSIEFSYKNNLKKHEKNCNKKIFVKTENE